MSTIQRLSEQEALDEIIETVKLAEKGEAPFALVLGSGFSRGLVPTARELVVESIPLWMKCRDEGIEFGDHTQGAIADVASNFWKQFVERNKARGLDLKLDSATGLPEDNGEAYRAAFSPRYGGAVGKPGEARKFQRALMQLNKPRLNAAHFLLASLLGVQPGKTRESSLFRSRAAFSRLILTTNFDPFLQTALQAVNRLYFMSDTPELGVTDEIFDDQTDAIHLVYLHGSIHRRSQAATDEEIQRLKEKNAGALEPVLKRRGVIVLGYSGWDDAIVAALEKCDVFDYKLYWCGLESDPLAKGAFGRGVESILRKHSAVYVQSAGAGKFMAQLCRGLVKGNPRLLDNPIGQLRDLLDSIDLNELEDLTLLISEDPSAPQPIQSANPATTLVQAKLLTIERLTQAELIFLGKIPTSSVEMSEAAVAPVTKDAIAAVAPLLDSKSKIQQVISSAQLSLALGNYEETFKRSNEALLLAELEPSQRAELLALSAQSHHLLGRSQEAIEDWSKVIDLVGASVEQIAVALINRGFVFVGRGDSEAAIADYTRVIEQLPGAPVESVAQALYNRGVTWSQKGKPEAAIVDYTRVIEQLPGAPPNIAARSLNNRGVTWGQKGEGDKELADYTRVIEQLPGAPVDQVAYALYNRGVTWGKKGERDKAVEDYTRLADQLPGAPVDQMAKALNNRGVAWGQKGESEKELADYTRVIEQLPGAPVDQLAYALNNRGLTWGNRGEIQKGVEDFTRLIEQLPGAPVDQVARALNNRGGAWGQKGELEKSLDDFTRLIEQLPEAPVDQVARALNNRGVAWEEKGEREKSLDDFTRLIEQLPEAPIDQVALALNNRGVAWRRKGEAEKEMADYTRVIEQLPGAPIDQVAYALNNRGVAWGQKGATENELADYTRVIEQLPGAPIDKVAFALNNRGVAWGQKGEGEKALDDFTRLIEQLPGAPVEQVAMALVNRGVMWVKEGDTGKAAADYSQVIELPGAPVPQVAQALSGLGWVNYLKNDFSGFLANTEASLSNDPGLDYSAFNLGLALLASGRDAEALAAYRAAGERYADSIERLGLEDLRDASQKWLTEERAQPVIQLLESLKK